MVEAGKEAVEEKYEGYREAAREHTHFTLSQRIISAKLPLDLYSLDLIAITDLALEEATEWEFPWRRIVGQNRPYLRRFEIAVWSHGRLLALGVGRASNGPDNVTIHFMERLRENNPLAGFVAQIVADAADNYAKVIGRQRVKLKNPAAEVLPKYRSIGFSLAETFRGVTYWERRVL